MPQQSFAAAIGEWATKVKGAQEAIFKESASRVIEEMQKVGPSVASTKASIAKGLASEGRGKKKTFRQGPVRAAGEGGRMPVDSGALRASLLVSTAVPTPRNMEKVEGKTYNYEADAANLAIASAKPGDTLYATYGMSYARAVEYGARGRAGYGFVRLSAQQWPQIVDRVVADLKGRLGLE